MWKPVEKRNWKDRLMVPMDSLGLENVLLESVVFGKTREGTREEKQNLRMRGGTHRCGQQNGPTEVDSMVGNSNGMIFPPV